MSEDTHNCLESNGCSDGEKKEPPPPTPLGEKARASRSEGARSAPMCSLFLACFRMSTERDMQGTARTNGDNGPVTSSASTTSDVIPDPKPGSRHYSAGEFNPNPVPVMHGATIR